MKKNNIYLATKLYSFFDRKASVIMYNSVLNSKKFRSDYIYLPFKDSNMKVSPVGNVAKNIFEADINSLNNTDVFITRLDGTSYDAGVGFEIGYCLAKRVPLYIFNTDFYFNLRFIKKKRYAISYIIKYSFMCISFILKIILQAICKVVLFFLLFYKSKDN